MLIPEYIQDGFQACFAVCRKVVQRPEILVEIIKDLFRIILYSWTKLLYIPGRFHMIYLEKIYKKIK